MLAEFLREWFSLTMIGGIVAANTFGTHYFDEDSCACVALRVHATRHPLNPTASWAVFATE